MSPSLEIGGHVVELSNPDKVLFPRAGLTKRDLFEFFRRIHPVMAPHLAGRPVSFERFPDGIEAPGFFQKNVPEHFPKWIRRASLVAQEGAVDYLVVENAATLGYLAQAAAITLHVGLGRVDAPQRPDRLVFDLDPSGDDLDGVRLGARRLKERLVGSGLVPYVMSTGSRGLHVVCALDRTASFDRARTFARTLATEVADGEPDRLTVETRKNERAGRVFIDYLRNAYGQTTVAPYGLRALPEAPVATPLDWPEVDRDFDPRRYTVANIFRRLGQKPDPWRDIEAHRRALPS